MEALTITRDFLINKSEQRNRIKRALMLAEEYYKKLDTALNGPAKNFLPGYLTVDQVRGMLRQVTDAKRELQYDLEVMEHELFQ